MLDGSDGDILAVATMLSEQGAAVPPSAVARNAPPTEAELLVMAEALGLDR